MLQQCRVYTGFRLDRHAVCHDSFDAPEHLHHQPDIQIHVAQTVCGTLRNEAARLTPRLRAIEYVAHINGIDLLQPRHVFVVMPMIRSTEYDETKVRALSRPISRSEIDKADTPITDTAALYAMELGQLGQLGQVFVACQRRSAA